MDIFDIDSALDRLEENLLDERSISTKNQQQIDIAKQQQNKDFEEENGNESLSDGEGASESLNDNKSEFAPFCSEVKFLRIPFCFSHFGPAVGGRR